MFQSTPNPLNRPLAWAPPLVLLALAATLLLSDLNRPLFLLINHHLGGPLAPSLWQSVTILGDGMMGIALLLILHRQHPRLTYTALIAAIIAGLWVHLLKNAFALPRPPAVIDPESIVILGPTYKHGSFPSGHSSTAFAMAGCLVIWMRAEWQRWGMPLLLGIAALVAISRSVVGVHWPLDILMGAAIGWHSAMVATLFTVRFAPGPALLRGVGWLFALCTLYLLLRYDTDYAAAQPLQHGFALFALGLVCLRIMRDESATAAPGRV
jgi:membrane-associated phospholipid phosphatase